MMELLFPRRRRGQYQRLHGRRKMQVARFHGGPAAPRHQWRVRARRRLRVIGLALVSPLRLLGKLKSAYVHMMVNLAGQVGQLNTANVFGSKRIPRSRSAKVVYSGSEIEQRLIVEIYKALQIVSDQKSDQEYEERLSL